jgi:hypothetical protein
LPALSAPRIAEPRDELARYLSTDPEQVKDIFLWWNDQKASYPHLSRMALDYFSIPGKSTFHFHIQCVITDYFSLSATSTDVKRVFSQGRLVLSHIRNSLSAQSTRALLCLSNWSLLGYIKDKDITAVTILPEILGDEEELEAGWDSLDEM